MIKEVLCQNWIDFEQKARSHLLEGETIIRNTYPRLRHSGLFRGQSNSEWPLQTTLERFFVSNSLRREFPTTGLSVDSYDDRIIGVFPAFVSQSNNSIVPSITRESDRPKIGHHSRLPNYEFMVYLRHIGFPSPLLDWTRSFYVAAYFAFRDAWRADSVAIYYYREFAEQTEAHRVESTRIVTTGPYIFTHRRHYIQQCEYTVCVRVEGIPSPEQDGREYKRYYVAHEAGDFSDQQEKSNFIVKYIIPSRERRAAMNQLAEMNINGFSLFVNEEGLAEHLANLELIKEVFRSDRRS